MDWTVGWTVGRQILQCHLAGPVRQVNSRFCRASPATEATYHLEVTRGVRAAPSRCLHLPITRDSAMHGGPEPRRAACIVGRALLRGGRPIGCGCGARTRHGCATCVCVRMQTPPTQTPQSSRSCGSGVDMRRRGPLPRDFSTGARAGRHDSEFFTTTPPAELPAPRSERWSRLPAGERVRARRARR